MKQHQLKIFIFIIFISFSSFSQPQIKYNLVSEVNKSLPKYGFVIEGNKIDSIFYNYVIKIYEAEAYKLIQSINMEDYVVLYTDYEYPYIDPLIDLNFDSYKDLCVAAGSGQNGKNQLFDIFLFDTLKEEFSQNPSFEVYNIEVNDSLKFIYEAFWTGTCQTDCIVYNTYEVINNKLMLLESDYKEYDPKIKKLRRFIEAYKNGKLISKKEVGLEEDPEY